MSKRSHVGRGWPGLDGGAGEKTRRDNAGPKGPENGGNMAMAENLITVREAANFLRISARTVYRLIESGQIGAVRIGKQWRIPANDLPGVTIVEGPNGPQLQTQAVSNA